MDRVGHRPTVSLALLDPPGPDQRLDELAPLFAEIVVCVDPPLEACLAARWPASWPR